MKTIVIEGMQCDHCKARVEKALQQIEGINSVEVSLENKQANIECDENLDISKVKERIEDLGFEVAGIN